MDNYLPPQNIEAEESILSACLVDPEAMIEAADCVSPDDFYRTAHRDIFESMLKLFGKDEPVDLVTLTNQLRKDDKIEKCGGISEISKIIDAVPRAVNVGHYCQIIRDAAVKRRLIEQCNAIMKSCYESSNGAKDVLDRAQSMITGINFESKDQVCSVSKCVLDSIDRYEVLFNNQDRITGVPTGISLLDKITCGWQETDLIVIAGRPSMGKSAIAWTFADYAAMKGYPVLMFSLEMSVSQHLDRAFAKKSGVNTQKFRYGQFSMDDWSKITDAAHKLSESQIYIDDSSAVGTQYIRRVSRKYYREKGIKLIIIDHLQLMRAEKAYSRDREIGLITSGLKGLAKDLHIPVM